jgi:hypothetical protein
LRKRNGLCGAIAFGNQARVKTLLALDLCLDFEDALQQDGVFRHHASFLDLQVLDQRALLGGLSSQTASFSGMILRSLVRPSSSIIGRWLVQMALRQNVLRGRA